MKFFHKIGFLLREHWLILVTALALTSILFYPIFALPHNLKSEYQGINFVHFGTDSHFYLTRAKEALEGKPMGNPFLREGKDELDLFFMFNERVLTAPWRMLGLADTINIVHLYNAYNFIGIIGIILLLYSLVLFLGKNKMLGVVTAISVVGGYHLVYDKNFFYNDFNIYGRPMFPYISSLVFFTYVNVLARALHSLNKKYFVYLGLALGAIFYTYFFAWTFALSVQGALVLLYAYRRDWSRVKFLVGTGIMGVVLGSYLLYQMAMFFTSDFGHQSEYFHWSAKGRTPIFSKIGALSLMVLGALWYKKRNDPHLVFLLGLIGAMWVALNQQVITGKLLQIGHYYWYFIVPCAIIIAWYAVWQCFESKKWQSIVTVITVIFIFAHSLVGQYRSSLTTIEVQAYEQTYRPALDILKAESGSGVVLMADDHLSGLVTVYTQHDLFWDRSALMTKTSLERFKEVLYVFSFVNGESRADFSAYYARVMADHSMQSYYKQLFKAIEGLATGFDYYLYNGKLAKDDAVVLATRNTLLPQMNTEYLERAGTPDLARVMLKKYGVRYIIWDKKNHPEWNLDFITNKEILLTTPSLVLYKLPE